MKIIDKVKPQIFLIVIFLVVFIFFNQFFFKGLLPIPADTIIGLYHPFRDLYAKDYPRGIPFKNFLITDPVRQQYPWRHLVISQEKNFEIPLWNPYNLAGAPLLANHQSSVFYPLNLFFLILPFNLSWSFLIILEPLLAGIFLFLFLDSLKLNRAASLFGSIVFSFSGFFISWMEWGTILHAALWTPLILLSIDKIFLVFKKVNFKFQIPNLRLLIWCFIFIFSLTSSFLAGHLQIFFYLFLVSSIYFIIRWIQIGKNKDFLILFIILNSLFIILTSIQWLPTLQFIFLSGRNLDQIPWQNPGWFMPWQHLIQFVAPDFFGNPTTLNYWGEWNYGEFLGYIGILPLVFSLYSLFFRRDRRTLFFGTIFFLSLIFFLPTIFAKIPYILNLPFIKTAQPTRLLFLADFSLAILSSLGLDWFLKTKNKNEVFYPIIFLLLIFISLWIFVYYGENIDKNLAHNLVVAKRNLILPSIIFLFSSILIFFYIFFDKKNKNIILIFFILVFSVTIFDLFRAGWKFVPFTKRAYLFPKTKILSFLQEKNDSFRVMSTDSRILPPNFSIIYRIQSIDGYDPLYLLRYAELISASERGRPDISFPFGFNRIITPQNYSSKIINLLGVKYILSLADLRSDNLVKIFQEGETRVYENKKTLPRAFFVERVKTAAGKKEAIEEMFKEDFNPAETAVVEAENSLGVNRNPPPRWTKGKAEVVNYSENQVVIQTDNLGNGFLVLTDSFYPSWHAKIDGRETIIYRTDFAFRGIIVPKGKHTIEFYVTLL